jgi:formylglycine-generating enzyme required for sulfatase activity/serine/threonine protein kinase
MLTPNTTLQDRYRVVRLLGKGGMGAVYEAIDQRVSCVVALKETLVGADSGWRRAFEREAGLLANLRHPVLPKVTDFFSEGDSEFLVMEFIPGYDLGELLELRGAPFPQNQVLRWGNQLLTVLDYLHSHQPPIIHRDIKPANLKLTREGEVFLLDFGLAKGAAGQMSTLKTSKSLRGFTPKYAPIEQFHGRTDPTSDLFSLAATFYHLLTNTMAADAPTRQAAIDEGDPDPLQMIDELNPQVSPRIAAVMYQAMAMNRRHRYGSAPEMKRAFQFAVEEDERFAAEEEYRRVGRRQLRQGQATVEEDSGPREEGISRRKQNAHLQDETDQMEFQRESPRGAEIKLSEGRIEIESKRAKLLDTIPAPSQSVQKSTPFSKVEGPSSEAAISTAKSAVRETQFDNDWVSASFADTRAFGRKLIEKVQSRRIAVVAVAIVAIVVAALIMKSIANRSVYPSLPVKHSLESDNKTIAPVTPEGMVYVPGGTFMMGRDDGDEYERPAHSVTLKPFFMDINEVTNEDYEKFVSATNRKAPADWKSQTYPEGAARKPVTWVTWDDAAAYAQWAGKRLPTEEEWEFAARGTDGRRYPWGNKWEAGLANANGASRGMADVVTYRGTSQFGAVDMVGNAWEWTDSVLKAYPGGQLPEQPPDNTKVLRGGSYKSDKSQATATYRMGWRANDETTYSEAGFRCVKDITNISTTP